VIFREIVHLPKSELNSEQTNIYNTAFRGGVRHSRGLPAYGATTTTTISNPTAVSIPGYQKLPSITVGSVTKSNFVTTDGYVPSYINPNPIPQPLYPIDTHPHSHRGGRHTKNKFSEPLFAETMANAAKNLTNAANQPHDYTQFNENIASAVKDLKNAAYQTSDNPQLSESI
jgi:hypothetical protein